LGGDKTEEVAEAPKESVKPAFIEFGKTVVNLGDSANRYLSIMTTLQIDEPDSVNMTAEVERMKPILQSWLLNHCSDKTMEDIKGAAGQHQLRREILDHFNEVLCPDGQDKIRDVLFLEFNVQ
jgi:flagellar basal body-associated protein FliL